MGVLRMICGGMVLMVSMAVGARAQLEYTNWIFGLGTGLSFNDGAGALVSPPIPNSGNMLRTYGETAAWSDPCSGVLELYTDGGAIRDANHEVIEGGEDMSSGMARFSGATMFVPHPGNGDTLFLVSMKFIEISQPVYRSVLTYILRTMSRAGSGKPWKVTAVRPFGTYLEDSYGRVAATQDAARTGYWIFTMLSDTEAQVSGIAAFHIGVRGFEGTPVFSPVSYAGVSGQFACSRDGTRLVIVGRITEGASQQGRVTIIDVDKVTGRCTLRGRIDLVPYLSKHDHDEQTADRYAYGACFSPSGRYCYFSTRMTVKDDGLSVGKGLLLQFDLDAGSWQDVQNSGIEIGTPPLHVLGSMPGGLLAGPDDVIYVGGETRLSTILEPDVKGIGCTYVLDGPVHVGGTASFTMPKIIESSFLKTTSGQCFPAVITFSGTSVCEGEPLMIRLRIAGWNRDTSWIVTGPGGIQRTQQGGDVFTWPSAPAGSYTVSVTVRGFFGNVTETMEVDVHPLPVVDAGDTVNVCPGGSTTLRATGAMTYRWSPAAGLDDTTSANPVVKDVTNDRRYIVTGRSEYGCIARDTVWVRAAPLVGTMTAPDTVCDGEEAVITVKGGARIQWVEGYASSDPLEYSIRVRPTVTTTYRAIVVEATCSDTVEATIDVLPLPSLDVSEDTTICAGARVRLSARGAMTYRWEGAGLDDATSAEPMAMPETTAVYRVTATGANGCVVVDSVLVVVQPYGVVAMADTMVCEGSRVRLEATGEGVRRWFRLPDRDPLSGDTPEIIATVTADYMVMAENGHCIGSDTVRITVEPMIDLQVSADTTICTGDALTLHAEGSEHVEWSMNGERLPDDRGRITVAPEVTTVYVVAAMADHGCRTTDTVVVTVEDARRFVVTAPMLTAKPDDRLSIPVRIQSAGYRGPLDISVTITPPIVRLDDADTGRRTIVIVDDDQTMTVRGLVLLAGLLEATVDPVIHMDTSSRCFDLQRKTGSVALEGCALDRRAVRMSGMLSVWATTMTAGLSIEMEGGTGTYDVTWYDPYGRATYRASGLMQREILLLPGDLTPLGFLDVRSGAERIVMPMMVRGN